jgi:hypothetical protein
VQQQINDKKRKKVQQLAKVLVELEKDKAELVNHGVHHLLHHNYFYFYLQYKED